MTRYSLPLLLLTTLLGCAAETSDPQEPEPLPTDLPTALPIAFDSARPVPCCIPDLSARFQLEGRRLIVTGQQQSGSFPMRYVTVSATQYRDSVIINLAHVGGPYPSVDLLNFTLTVDSLLPRPMWVRIRNCHPTYCPLIRDTVLFAPYPGRRPAGYEAEPLLPGTPVLGH